MMQDLAESVLKMTIPDTAGIRVMLTTELRAMQQWHHAERIERLCAPKVYHLQEAMLRFDPEDDFDSPWDDDPPSRVCETAVFRVPEDKWKHVATFDSASAAVSCLNTLWRPINARTFRYSLKIGTADGKWRHVATLFNLEDAVRALDAIVLQE